MPYTTDLSFTSACKVSLLQCEVVHAFLLMLRGVDVGVWADVGGKVWSHTSRGGTSAVNGAWRVPVTRGVQDIGFQGLSTSNSVLVHNCTHRSTTIQR